MGRAGGGSPLIQEDFDMRYTSARYPFPQSTAWKFKPYDTNTT
jgi:hypothetical protein